MKAGREGGKESGAGASPDGYGNSIPDGPQEHDDEYMEGVSHCLYHYKPLF